MAHSALRLCLLLLHSRAPAADQLGWVCLQKGTLRPDIPPWCEPSWTHLMHSCWALDPAQRPSFRSMALELEHLLHLLAHAGS